MENDLKQMFADYQKNQGTNKKKSAEEILAKYFVPRKAKEIFRILPYKGKLFYATAFFHVVPVNIKGGLNKTSTIYCPAHNDPAVPKIGKDGQPVMDLNGNPVMVPAYCPLCEQAKKTEAKMDKSIKYVKKENMTPAQLAIREINDKFYKEMTQWQAKQFYIVRGIDKGQEKDGVKFWRFKFNFRNQGVLDKLMPPLEDFCEQHKVHFADENVGTDISITMGESTFMGNTYKAVSAITTKGKSPLHSDPVVAQQWLDDPITWRDVFKPKNAPAITSTQFLELIVEGNSPYWEDTDPDHKHWVFPNHPDLEALANTRKLGDGSDEENFQHASDIEDGVNIVNVTKQDVGTYKDDSIDVAASLIKEQEASKAEVEKHNEALTVSTIEPVSIVNNQKVETTEDIDGDELDGLPF